MKLTVNVMKRFLLATAASLLCTLSIFAGPPAATPTIASSINPWDRHAVDFETGMLWKVGGDTPLNYRIVPFMVSWRSPRVIGHDFDNGAALIVRNRLTFMANWFETGAENRYLGIAGAPSIELWSPCKCWALFGSIGGGIGLVDSQGVVGGQGRDLTLNWFGQLGVEHRLNDNLSLRVSSYFQHHSNGGATNPNPGLNSLGALVGLGWTF